MAIVFQRASRSYSARVAPYSISGNIPAGVIVRSLKVSLTRESWPEGALVDVVLTFPDGSTTGFSAAGGDLLDRQGNLLLSSSVTWTKYIDGQPANFPVGAYTLDFYLHQDANTAVTIERFAS